MKRLLDEAFLLKKTMKKKLVKMNDENTKVEMKQKQLNDEMIKWCQFHEIDK